jgi:biopolymer transport protein ExbD
MRARAQAVSDEIPTSSMADIAFLLIVYFLITMAFTVTRGLDFALPHDRDEPREIQRVESVLIEVLPTGKLLVDSRSLRSRSCSTTSAPGCCRTPARRIKARNTWYRALVNGASSSQVYGGGG